LSFTRRLLIPALALSLSACAQNPPLAGPSLAPSGPLASASSTPHASSAASPSPAPSPAASAAATGAPLRLHLQADASLSGFATTQQGPFNVCLRQIASTRTHLSFDSVLGESARAALLAAGASYESLGGHSQVDLSSKLNLQTLLGGIDISLAGLPTGRINGRSSFYDAAGQELGFVSWEASLQTEGQAIAILLRPSGPVNPADSCPALEAVLTGATLDTTGGQIRPGSLQPTPSPLPAPGLPLNLKVVEATTTSLTLQWDFGENARSHKLYLDGQLVAEGQLSPYFRFEGLVAANNYRLGVQSVNPDGQSEIVSMSAATTRSGSSGSGNFSGGGSDLARLQLQIIPADEFQVNSNTTERQLTPDIAMDQDGDYVLVWSEYTDYVGSSIRGQRYRRNHEPRGEAFEIASSPEASLSAPKVSMDRDGDFVVTWHDRYREYSSYSEIHARRFNADGEAQAEFTVNSSSDGQPMAPDVAMEDNGDFVISWFNPKREGSGIYARRFDAGGKGLGSDFLVSPVSSANYFAPAIAMDADGDFVVVWAADSYNYGEEGILGQRFTADGRFQGGAFEISQSGLSSPKSAQMGINPLSVDMNAQGQFVVAWTHIDNPKDKLIEGDLTTEVRARRYSVSGQPLADEFQVASFAGGRFRYLTTGVALNQNADFVIAWSGGSETISRIMGKAYQHHGTAIGKEFMVNSYTSGPAEAPSLAMDADGDFVVTWFGFPESGTFGRGEILARPYQLTD
ncbi:MAG: hypothetical protein ACAI44_09135, partial [Candidatus Sericytochromatia bacterium]